MQVFVHYCDGASYSGDSEEPVLYKPKDSLLHFSGRRILDAIFDDLIENQGKSMETPMLLLLGRAALPLLLLLPLVAMLSSLRLGWGDDGDRLVEVEVARPRGSGSGSSNRGSTTAVG